MGVFKEHQIEETDFILQDIQVVRDCYHALEEKWDGHSLFFPHYAEELGGLLPHEQSRVPASCVFDLVKYLS